MASKWFKLKIKGQAKGKGKVAEQTQEFQAKMATREDDFTDKYGTHFSA